MNRSPARCSAGYIRNLTDVPAIASPYSGLRNDRSSAIPAGERKRGVRHRWRRRRNIWFPTTHSGSNGRDPQPSHVELVRQMLMECPPETRLNAPRSLIGLDLTDEPFMTKLAEIFG